jgi:ubiquinone/menaquinone biosynthesis C-methylase UbiE
MNRDNEEQRIKEAYAERSSRGDDGTYSWLNPATAFHLQRQEQAVLRLLRKERVDSLAGTRILEVGCGGGSELRNFIKYGSDPELLYGVDILEDRIAQGKRINPDLNLLQLNAEHLPFEDDSFDIVCQFVMFTSILDASTKVRIADEMLRVLKPEGLIIWYDYFVSRPGNNSVKGVSRKEIVELFPGCHIQTQKVTLAPPLSRAIVPRSKMLAIFLEKLPFLRTHYLASIRKTV